VAAGHRSRGVFGSRATCEARREPVRSSERSQSLSKRTRGLFCEFGFQILHADLGNHLHTTSHRALFTPPEASAWGLTTEKERLPDT